MKVLKKLFNFQVEKEKEKVKKSVKRDIRSFRRGFALGACAAGCGCLLYLHRNAINAAIKGKPMPEPPKWHFWCRT
ncbi:MAG: hypothetical protein IJU29_02960 [Oscillospiraceae bacterium]|nr:hypothetical protein [Oscillospiraceae bacterium]